MVYSSQRGRSTFDMSDSAVKLTTILKMGRGYGLYLFACKFRDWLPDILSPQCRLLAKFFLLQKMQVDPMRCCKNDGRVT